MIHQLLQFFRKKKNNDIVELHKNIINLENSIKKLEIMFNEVKINIYACLRTNCVNFDHINLLITKEQLEECNIHGYLYTNKLLLNGHIITYGEKMKQIHLWISGKDILYSIDNSTPENINNYTFVCTFYKINDSWDLSYCDMYIGINNEKPYTSLKPYNHLYEYNKHNSMQRILDKIIIPSLLELLK